MKVMLLIKYPCIEHDFPSDKLLSDTIIIKQNESNVVKD